jgi:eukaryotic-like serine/threonine-protein kinase
VSTSGEAKSMVGQVLHETYRLERAIGEGGMGAVYEASHTRLTRRFAVKVLDPLLTKECEATARFRREAEITGGIGHPHIVEVIDFNHTPDGGFYMVMELLDGEDLATRLARVQRLPIEKIARLLMQAASALEAAHRHNVIHRDLKPHNIFLCRRGQRDDFVKVVDFGISKVIGADSMLTRTHAIMGTPHYMAPEQIAEGAAEVDARADIYALASIVYETLTGAPPFTAESVSSLLFKVVYQDPVPLDQIRPDVPASVSAVVARAMHKQRMERFASMADFWNAFATAMRQEHLAVPETAADRQLLWGGEPAPPPAPTPLSQAETLAPYSQPELDQAAARLAALPTGIKINRPTTLSVSHGEIIPARRSRRRFGVAVVAALALIGASAGIIAGLILLRSTGGAPGTKAASRPADQRQALALAAAPDAARVPPDAARVSPDAVQIPPDVAVKIPSDLATVRTTPVSVRKTPKHVLLSISAPRRLAEIFIDGKNVGQTPLFGLKVRPGRHRFEARAVGHLPVKRTLDIKRGGDNRIVFDQFTPLPR